MMNETKQNDGVFKSVLMAYSVLVLHVLLIAGLGLLVLFFRGVIQYMIWIFLGGAAALLFPIDWPEPFGLVMIEAMACGTPVIAWRNGSVPEVITDGVTGFIVDTALTIGYDAPWRQVHAMMVEAARRTEGITDALAVAHRHRATPFRQSSARILPKIMLPSSLRW